MKRSSGIVIRALSRRSRCPGSRRAGWCLIRHGRSRGRRATSRRVPQAVDRGLGQGRFNESIDLVHLNGHTRRRPSFQGPRLRCFPRRGGPASIRGHAGVSTGRSVRLRRNCNRGDAQNVVVQGGHAAPQSGQLRPSRFFQGEQETGLKLRALYGSAKLLQESATSVRADRCPENQLEAVEDDDCVNAELFLEQFQRGCYGCFRINTTTLRGWQELNDECQQPIRGHIVPAIKVNGRLDPVVCCLPNAAKATFRRGWYVQVGGTLQQSVASASLQARQQPGRQKFGFLCAGLGKHQRQARRAHHDRQQLGLPRSDGGGKFRSWQWNALRHWCTGRLGSPYGRVFMNASEPIEIVRLQIDSDSSDPRSMGVDESFLVPTLWRSCKSLCQCNDLGSIGSST